MLSPGIPSMMAELGVSSRPVATFSVSIYILGLGLGPMFVFSVYLAVSRSSIGALNVPRSNWRYVCRIFAPLSEMYGRKILYNLTNVAFAYFTALAGVASQLPVLIMLRFFQGCSASVPVVIGGGTIVDLYPPETRGLAMSIYFFSGMLGPPLGPIAGGFISQYLSWRWIFGITASIVCGIPVTTSQHRIGLRPIVLEIDSNSYTGPSRDDSVFCVHEGDTCRNDNQADKSTTRWREAKKEMRIYIQQPSRPLE